MRVIVTTLDVSGATVAVMKTDKSVIIVVTTTDKTTTTFAVMTSDESTIVAVMMNDESMIGYVIKNLTLEQTKALAYFTHSMNKIGSYR